MEKALNNRLILWLVLFGLFVGCDHPRPKEKSAVQNDDVVIGAEEKAEEETAAEPVLSETECYFESLELIDIQSVNENVLVELKYATTDNFTGKILYADFSRAYLQRDAAEKLSVAQQNLENLHPGFRLLAYDAARPFSVQEIMWKAVQGTPYSRYVAHPERKSLHNYGAAVDLTVVDSSKIPLDMGTPFDYFGGKASIHNEDSLIRIGQLTPQQVENRKLLRKVMQEAGFIPIRGEWWHFNACSLQEAQERYSLIE